MDQALLLLRAGLIDAMLDASLAQVHRERTKINSARHTQRHYHSPYLPASISQHGFAEARRGCKASKAAKINDDVRKGGFPERVQVVNCNL